ncbi:phosphate transport system permease protein [Terrihabitans soli]|uniref:Phosphate transport system permease protein n=1 Tax=Terrihabitans soli TaxID=708113 RepID=A0A6S6QNE0_9HYPH|nr:phosphate ABC transporter permease subunit PstC [Terrihabitans soli]BCJ90926.1 phosphate transport system permease protein [Terrihabitans soli]
MAWIYLLVAAALAALGFYAGRARAYKFRADGAAVHSLPGYHGYYVALAIIIPMAALFILWSVVEPKLLETQALNALPQAFQPVDELARATRLREIQNVAAGQTFSEIAPEVRAVGEGYAHSLLLSHWAKLVVGIALGFLGYLWAMRRLTPLFRARNTVEKIVKIVLLSCSIVAVITTLGIVFSVLFETMRFFARSPWWDFLFGLHWSPQTAMRADQVGSSGAFGAVPLFVGTTLIMFIAMLVAAPIGLFSAIYMAEYASPRVRSIAKPVLEVLAGVPTVVFGFFAALTVAPVIRRLGESAGIDVASESALAAGLVMGVMIIPFVSSLSDDVINAVPQSLRDGSYGMGATKSETIKKVVLPAALPGIVSAMMLAVSRAVGETMIVVMAAGLAANLTFNPLEAVTTVTVQIKTLLTGDQEFDSAKTLSAFALGFVLFFFTLAMNYVALQVVRRYREQYD